MDYEMEELLPVVARLTETYTGFEHTSITYEKAEQLMGAVLYCIRELELPGGETLASKERISAQQAYEIGVACVEKKAKEALDCYNEVLPEFHWYENRCLYDTFVQGIPEFFKWYDIKFHPQDTILTLDYPVLKDISMYTGIDRIYEFIRCIYLEQMFLNKFPQEYVTAILSEYCSGYKSMIDNLCEIVLMSVIWHILAGKPLSEQQLSREDFLRIQAILREHDVAIIQKKLEEVVERFAESNCGDSMELTEYLTGAIPGIIIRMKEATYF
ncbi:MAG: hypothetical protein HFI74_08055 [Lachnospiraceae bacterium]|jgi:hypothetical protein|nr:hypothetical protein [Lachnospiraceae bacterium]